MTFADNLDALALILTIFFTMVGLLSKGGIFWFFAAAASMVLLAVEVGNTGFTFLAVIVILGLMGMAFGLNKSDR